MNQYEGQREDSDVGKSYKRLSIPAYSNGTPFSDAEWQKWYGHKSNKERFVEMELEKKSDE